MKKLTNQASKSNQSKGNSIPDKFPVITQGTTCVKINGRNWYPVSKTSSRSSNSSFSNGGNTLNIREWLDKNEGKFHSLFNPKPAVEKIKKIYIKKSDDPNYVPAKRGRKATTYDIQWPQVPFTVNDAAKLNNLPYHTIANEMNRDKTRFTVIDVKKSETGRGKPTNILMLTALIKNNKPNTKNTKNNQSKSPKKESKPKKLVKQVARKIVKVNLIKKSEVKKRIVATLVKKPARLQIKSATKLKSKPKSKVKPKIKPKTKRKK